MENKGITLVALVVTIIIMLILAGVTLRLTLGDNGLIKMAKDVVEAYEESSKKEENAIDKLLEDMSHLNPENAGKEVDVPREEKDKWDLSKVTPVADGKGNTIPVPKNFYYAGGNIDTGFVISSESGDDLNNSKHGNQFVWIPCTVTQYNDAIDDVMEKGWSSNNQYQDNGDDNYIESDGQGLGKDWSNNYDNEDKTFIDETYKNKDESATLPTSTWEKNQTTKATKSIGTYGGFYIARFESGIPSNATTFYKTVESKDLTYNTERGSIVDTVAIKDLKPISQKGVQAWNYITQPNAKMVAENMYNGTGSVRSYLVDSPTWNIVCNMYDKMLGTSDSERKITNSTKFGNHSSNTTTDYTKVIGLWAKHGGSVTGWIAAKQYENRQITDDDIKGETGRAYIELPTGASEDFKLYNIYDMAGNMWEWTTEHNIKKGKMFVVRRGGCYITPAQDYAVANAYANNEFNYYASDVGFRVVLYIK